MYVTFLKRNEKSALLYVFRPDRLEKDLSQPAVQNVLKAVSYTHLRRPEVTKLIKKCNDVGAGGVSLSHIHI